MPSKSKEQAKLMAATCHNPEIAKKTGIPVKVACDFNKADKKIGILKDSEGNIVNQDGIQVIGNVTMDIPLLIRILEHAREELKSDNELHLFVENLLACQSSQEVLDMSCFDKIVPATVDESVPVQTGTVYSHGPKKHYSQKAMKIIDGAVHAISSLKTGVERTEALKQYCKDHKVKYQQVYDAIVQDTSSDYFTSNQVEEAAGSSKLDAIIDKAKTQKKISVGTVSVEELNDPLSFDSKWNVTLKSGKSYKVDEKGLRKILDMVLNKYSIDKVAESIISVSKKFK